MADRRNPIERVVDRANAAGGSLWSAVNAARALGFEIVAVTETDPRAALYHIESVAARITQLADEALAEARRAAQ